MTDPWRSIERAWMHVLRMLLLTLPGMVLRLAGIEPLAWVFTGAGLIYGCWIAVAILHVHDPFWTGWKRLGHKEGK